MTSCVEGKTHIMWTVDHIKVMKDKTTAAFAFTKIGTYVQNPPQEVFFMSSPNLLNEEQPSSVRDKLPPSTSFFANSRTLMGCTGPLRRGGRRTPSVSSRVGSLPLYADVRLHILMTRRNDVIRYCGNSCLGTQTTASTNTTPPAFNVGSQRILAGLPPQRPSCNCLV